MKHLINILVIVIFIIFALFIRHIENSYEVLAVYSPTKIGIDINNDKTITGEEIFSIPNIESFSTEPDDSFAKKYQNKYKISYQDIINLGFMAQEFAQNTLLHKKVNIINEKQIRINKTDYRLLLLQSGFGIQNERIYDYEKFQKKLKESKRLHIVVYNRHSNKYHSPHCKYAKEATDKIFIPKNQLSKDSIPCSYCIKNKKHKHKYKETLNISYKIPSITAPQKFFVKGQIKLLYTDYTKHLTPDKNCNTTECQELIKLVNDAAETIDISIYGYKEIPKITQALNEAKSRGVKIRIVYDTVLPPNINFYPDTHIIKQIAQESRCDNDNAIMHNKFAIFDNKILYTGSMNFSPTGFSGYDENNTIIINSEDIARLYKQEFEQMLKGKFHNKKSKHSGRNIFQVGQSTIEVYFSPQDKTAGRIITIINNSKKYIYIPAYLITHKEITQSLINANKRGVEIKIIIDANSCTMAKSKHRSLREAGIPVKIENYAGKMHSKTMIIDDEYIILGSMNFSNSGENKNDENTIILKNSDFAKHYKTFFLYLWKKIPDIYLKRTPKAESKESIGSCNDGIDNNFNGLTDIAEPACK